MHSFKNLYIFYSLKSSNIRNSRVVDLKSSRLNDFRKLFGCTQLSQVMRSLTRLLPNRLMISLTVNARWENHVYGVLGTPSRSISGHYCRRIIFSAKVLCFRSFFCCSPIFTASIFECFRKTTPFNNPLRFEPLMMWPTFRRVLEAFMTFGIVYEKGSFHN